MDSSPQSFCQFQLPEAEDPIYEATIYSISIVPEEIRERKKNAYLPKKFTIGPLCIGTMPVREQKRMAYSKESYMKHFCEKCSDDPQKKLKECMEAILGLDKEVRQSYVEEIKLDNHALARVILTDGCLLLVALLTYRDVDDCGDGTDVDYDSEVNLSDLVLLANQIPLFILRKLSEILSILELLPDGQIQYRARYLLGYPPSENPNYSTDNTPAAHILELAYSSIPEPDDGVEQKQMRESGHDEENTHVVNDHKKELEGAGLKRCATRLEAAGVKIRPGIAGKRSYSFNFGISFCDGTLEIPPLRITQSTETRWLNFIAWEHHINKMTGEGDWGRRIAGNASRCKCSWAALFFKALICSPGDVQLLKHREVIIVDDSVDMNNLQLMRYFHSITEDVADGTVVGSHYNKILDALNKYHRSPIHYATEIPIRLWHYWTQLPQQIIRDIYGFLTRGYHYAVAIIGVLGVLDTIYAVLSYHYPKK